ncbi:hypothetical protein, partial [Serratia oryzae]|uniref:hypothetical protein n=1 Tax=Serratia oryzae TaxID=2034155 RepID=UPI0019D673AB
MFKLFYYLSMACFWLNIVDFLEYMDSCSADDVNVSFCFNETVFFLFWKKVKYNGTATKHSNKSPNTTKFNIDSQLS